MNASSDTKLKLIPRKNTQRQISSIRLFIESSSLLIIGLTLLKFLNQIAQKNDGYQILLQSLELLVTGVITLYKSFTGLIIIVFIISLCILSLIILLSGISRCFKLISRLLLTIKKSQIGKRI